MLLVRGQEVRQLTQWSSVIVPVATPVCHARSVHLVTIEMRRAETVTQIMFLSHQDTLTQSWAMADRRNHRMDILDRRRHSRVILAL